jgi:hypothetical protein
MDDLKNRLKNAQLKVFPRARHGLPFSHGDKCGQAVGEFLAEVTARKAYCIGPKTGIGFGKHDAADSKC